MGSGPPQLSWQQECTAALSDALAIGRNGPAQWEQFRAPLTSPDKRIIIADASFDNQTLQDFDLSRCYITRSSFRGANLSGARFTRSIFRECDATGANIEGANFRGADMRNDGLILTDVEFDDSTDFEVGSELLPDELHPGLRSAASRARNRRRWRQRKSYSVTVQAMLWLTRDGYSLSWLMAIGLAVIGVFSCAYWSLSEATVIESVLTSLGYFLSLNSTYASGWPFALGALEAFCGMLFLAVLTAVLISMFYDKN